MNKVKKDDGCSRSKTALNATIASRDGIHMGLETAAYSKRRRHREMVNGNAGGYGEPSNGARGGGWRAYLRRRSQNEQEAAFLPPHPAALSPRLDRCVGGVKQT
ncbi:hypothetical protein ACJJTC_015476 [Scirpophaga incertulas]